jgi:hypothetical protein
MPAGNNQAYYRFEYGIRWSHETDIDDGNFFPGKPGEGIADSICRASGWQPTEHVSGVELGSGSGAMKFSRAADHQRCNGCSMRPRYRGTRAPVLVNRDILEDWMGNINAAVDQPELAGQLLHSGGAFGGAVGLGGRLTGGADGTAAVGVDMIEVEAGLGHKLPQAE